MPVLSRPEAHTHEIPGARFTSLATPSRGSQDTSVWRVELAPRTASSVHELTREEVFVLLSGSARVRLGDTQSVAGPGDAIVVPVNTPFALENCTDEPLTALCCLPVGGEARMPEGQSFVPPWAR